ncbi:CDP-alcohol phosphatidyltransferase family protein [Pseudogemmobacter sp. W21_MBD1_M6]|uniref:CDP-alcohol phosphatidyltransferase family protein n=1 Tax=Pseudogemmobacter sp. W21_MBD1_M6 TaxID=3240271 RepID=UPI003F98C8E8
MTEHPSKPERLPFLQILPNLVTILGLCAGLTSIRFVLADRFEMAVLLIIFAAVIDGLDGLIARRLKATSDIGAELDSLSDFLNFGVAPGLLVFQFSMKTETGMGWIFVLGYVSCCCLRLARFNVGNGKIPERATLAKNHFTGVPAPAGALLALFPVFLSFQGMMDATAMPWVAALTLGLTGAAMVSRVPTFSPKSILVPKEKIIWVLISAALIVGIMLTKFWLLMICADLVYAASVLRSVVKHYRK